jgi:hypothetical protein
MRGLIQDRSENEEIRISSFGCGPAVEIIDIMREIDPRRKVIFTCIDGEEKALQQIEGDLNKIPGIHGKSSSVRLVKENILELVRGRRLIAEYPLQDFIYCAGFLDYLSDRIAKKTIAHLLGFLKESGILTVVNVCAGECVERFFTEAAGEWFLHHRSAEEMQKLADGFVDQRRVHLEYDFETRKNVYLIIEK